jgi:hypothetical protein
MATITMFCKGDIVWDTLGINLLPCKANSTQGYQTIEYTSEYSRESQDSRFRFSKNLPLPNG